MSIENRPLSGGPAERESRRSSLIALLRGGAREILMGAIRSPVPARILTMWQWLQEAIDQRRVQRSTPGMAALAASEPGVSAVRRTAGSPKSAKSVAPGYRQGPRHPPPGVSSRPATIAGGPVDGCAEPASRSGSARPSATQPHSAHRDRPINHSNRTRAIASELHKLHASVHITNVVMCPHPTRPATPEGATPVDA